MRIALYFPLKCCKITKVLVSMQKSDANNWMIKFDYRLVKSVHCDTSLLQVFVERCDSYSNIQLYEKGSELFVSSN